MAGLLSKLRERSEFVFVVGLALSVASFVGNLHLGRDAAHFIVTQLAAIHGVRDSVLACASAVHAALEWWRNIINDALSLLPIQIPKRFHDPISFLFFVQARVWSRGSKFIRNVRQTFHNKRVRRSVMREGFIIDVSRASLLIAAIITLVVIDKFYQFGSIDIRSWFNAEPLIVLTYVCVLLAFLFLGLVGRFVARKERNRIVEYHVASARPRICPEGKDCDKPLNEDDGLP